MVYSMNVYKALGGIILFTISSVAILGVYRTNGVGWDFISHYLNGRSVAEGFGHAINPAHALSVGKNFYFDGVWEPLPSLLLAAFILFAGNLALPAYLLFLMAMLFLAAYATAKSLNVDPLMLSSIMASPYVISYTVLYNGNEILAASFSMLAMGLIVAKRSEAGILVGLAGLSKYVGLALLPMLLFVGKRRSTVRSLCMFALVTLPWLAVNWAIFGDPLQSYFLQLAETQQQSLGLGAFANMLGLVLWYPIVILAMVLAVAACFWAAHRLNDGKKLRRSIRTHEFIAERGITILFVSLLLSIAGFAFSFDNAQGAIRLGFLVYLSASMLVAVVLDRSRIGNMMLFGKRASEKAMPYAVFGTSMVLMIATCFNLAHSGFNLHGSVDSKNPVLSDAVSALKSTGISGCSIVSNAWPYMDYYNVTTYSPYYCNSTVARMPFLLFYNISAQDYCGGSVSLMPGTYAQFKYPAFSIYLPANYMCVK
jgi:hypothetical protein